MISWLLVIILAYLFFGLASLGDKLVLIGKPKPISYTFYTGFLGVFVLFLIPFATFTSVSMTTALWILLDAIVHMVGLYTMFVALKKFDVSRVVATIGATQPLFVFVLTWIFFGPQEVTVMEMIAFLLLLVGTIIISFEKSIVLTGGYLKMTIFSSLLFSLDYIFSKMIFLHQPFLAGIIWIRLTILLLVVLLLLAKSTRKEIFSKQVVLNKKTQGLFVITQASGGLANFLQSFAISLAPVVSLATMNSLRGLQYVFLFLITLGFTLFAPRILEESLSKKIIIQKIVSIVIIAAGLAVLVIK
jgi:drug/metabolite transporter (DMT)-like permease